MTEIDKSKDKKPQLLLFLNQLVSQNKYEHFKLLCQHIVKDQFNNKIGASTWNNIKTLPLFDQCNYVKYIAIHHEITDDCDVDLFRHVFETENSMISSLHLHHISTIIECNYNMALKYLKINTSNKFTLFKTMLETSMSLTHHQLWKKRFNETFEFWWCFVDNPNLYPMMKNFQHLITMQVTFRQIEKSNPILFGVFGDANWGNKEKLTDELMSELIDHFSKIQSRLHQELKNSQAALEQSLQEQQDFAYIASHDLQEPLRMVSSYLGLLKARCDRKLDDSERDFIDFAVDGAQRMKMMIQDILDLSRITTRGKEFEQEDLKHLAEKAKTSVLLTCDCKDPRIHWKDLPTLWVDRAQIQRIFTVLFANALTYCKESQAIIEVGASCQNGEWTISVQDNGIGIEERFYSRIFLLFQRLHTQEEYEGRGVGLAIVKKIIERHAGRIWVESAIGEGSTFYFTLPDRI